MGTKFEHIIDPFAATSTRTDTIAGKRVDDGENRRSRELRKMGGVDRLQDVMKRMLEKGDVELIRSTLQTHEDVFKNQVKQLHQLYSVQRRMMDELRDKIDQGLLDDPSSRERSGSFSRDRTRNSRGLKLERLEDAYTSTKKESINEEQVSPSARHDHTSKRMIIVDDDRDEDSEIELTLSVGGRKSKKDQKPLHL